MDLIAAADKNWAIGKDGKLLCHLPGDLKYFKEKTIGKTVVMGRKTLESLPGLKPLPNRKNIVLTTDRSFKKEGCEIVHSLDELLASICFDREKDLPCVQDLPKGQNLKTESGEQQVMVMGGASVYKQLLPYCQSCYITRIDQIFDADTYIPDLDNMENFALVWQSEPREENGITYRFTRYDRVKNER